MTNMPKSFQNLQAIETGSSDFHKNCLPVLKVFYTKQKTYWSISKLSEMLRRRNQFLNIKSEIDGKAYHKQRNYYYSE